MADDTQADVKTAVDRPRDNAGHFAPKTVTLVASALPFFVTSYLVPAEPDSGDEDLVFTAEGTEVPEADVDHLIEQAALAGVALTRKDA